MFHMQDTVTPKAAVWCNKVLKHHRKLTATGLCVHCQSNRPDYDNQSKTNLALLSTGSEQVLNEQ